MTMHVLIVDPDPLAAKMLAFVLNEGGYRATTLADPRRMEAVFVDQPTDLVVLEAELPRVDAFALCATLRGGRPEIPIILLSARASVPDKVRGLGSGADDFIAKPFDPAELLARVQTVLRRYRNTERNVVGATVRVGGALLDLNESLFRAPHIDAALTRTEMKVLECLMRHAHAVCTREMLVDRVWGYDCDASHNRVDVCIRRIRSKIEPISTEPTYIHTVRDRGYLFRDPDRAQRQHLSRMA